MNREKVILCSPIPNTFAKFLKDTCVECGEDAFTLSIHKDSAEPDFMCPTCVEESSSHALSILPTYSPHTVSWNINPLGDVSVDVGDGFTQTFLILENIGDGYLVLVSPDKYPNEYFLAHTNNYGIRFLYRVYAHERKQLAVLGLRKLANHLYFIF